MVVSRAVLVLNRLNTATHTGQNVDFSPTRARSPAPALYTYCCNARVTLPTQTHVGKCGTHPIQNDRLKHNTNKQMHMAT